jgi:uncharacterized protein YajQ (UPF0234 family)
MPSFDILSKAQMNEVDNALGQAQKEIAQRYDFKDTDTSRPRARIAPVRRSASFRRR